MRELETIATTRITAAEAFGLRRSYLKSPGPSGGPGDDVAVGLDDHDKKILKAIRGRQGKGAVFLLREKAQRFRNSRVKTCPQCGVEFEPVTYTPGELEMLSAIPADSFCIPIRQPTTRVMLRCKCGMREMP